MERKEERLELRKGEGVGVGLTFGARVILLLSASSSLAFDSLH